MKTTRHARLLWLCDDQASWGQFENLERFLREHGLPSLVAAAKAATSTIRRLVEYRPGVRRDHTGYQRGRPPTVVGRGVEPRRAPAGRGDQVGRDRYRRERLLSLVQTALKLLREQLPRPLPPLEPFSIEPTCGSKGGEMTTKKPKKPKRTKKAKLWLEVEYSPEYTDPESLATALDRLLETILSTPGIMDEYGDPTFGPCWVTSVRTVPSRGAIRSGERWCFPSRPVEANCRVKRWRPSSPRCKGCCISTWTETAANSGIRPRNGAAPTSVRISRTCCTSTVWFLGKSRIASNRRRQARLPARPNWSPGRSRRGCRPEDLDDEIHDQVGVVASNLNNRGLSAQIEFLVGQFGAVETRKLLTELVSDKAPRGTTP